MERDRLDYEIKKLSYKEIENMIQDIKRGVPVSKVVKIHKINSGISYTKEEVLGVLYKELKNRRGRRC